MKSKIFNQQTNNIINNQVEPIDLDDILLNEDVLEEEFYSENGFDNQFDLDFDMMANPEINNNQEYNINGNNENVPPTNTINNNIYDLNNTNTIFDQDIYRKK